MSRRSLLLTGNFVFVESAAMTPHEHFSIIGHNLFAAKLPCSLSLLKRVKALAPVLLLVLGLNALFSHAVSGPSPNCGRVRPRWRE